jgi:hypothetical protein
MHVFIVVARGHKKEGCDTASVHRPHTREKYGNFEKYYFFSRRMFGQKFKSVPHPLFFLVF